MSYEILIGDAREKLAEIPLLAEKNGDEYRLSLTTDPGELPYKVLISQIVDE